MRSPYHLQIARRLDKGRQRVLQQTEARVLLLPETCARLGFSVRQGQRLLAMGRFPVPCLPRVLGPKSRYRFSSVDVDRYLAAAASEV